MITVTDLATLYATTNVSDGDVAQVLGYRDEHDGGGGIFIYEASATLTPHFHENDNPTTSLEYYQLGYDINYDGMVCRAIGQTTGRWIRQWDRGKLNLRWFGGAPGNVVDASKALNVALKYAQFDNSDEVGVSQTVFNNVELTSTGKTIFIPTGRYYFRTGITTITKGVVIEGEGNMGTSANGTRLLIWQKFADIDSTILGASNDRYGFLRFYPTSQDNSGGGIKNLAIESPGGSNIPLSIPQANDPNFVDLDYNTNLVTLIAPSSSNAANPYTDPAVSDPAVTNWTAENLFFFMGARSLRAIFMRSYQHGGADIQRIRNISLINCWFSGAKKAGETVHAQNVYGLQVVGGFFASGTGVGATPVAPGIFLGGTGVGCKQVSLNGVDLTHGIIKIHQLSSFINIDCRYGLLDIIDNAGSNHEALQVTQRHVLNRRTVLPSYLQCPSNSINLTTSTNNTGRRCYNNSTDIAADPVWD